MAEFAGNWLSRNVLGYKDLPRYQPDLAKCVDHFVIHAGLYRTRKCGGMWDGLGCQGRQGERFFEVLDQSLGGLALALNSLGVDRQFSSTLTNVRTNARTYAVHPADFHPARPPSTLACHAVLHSRLLCPALLPSVHTLFASRRLRGAEGHPGPHQAEQHKDDSLVCGAAGVRQHLLFHHLVRRWRVQACEEGRGAGIRAGRGAGIRAGRGGAQGGGAQGGFLGSVELKIWVLAQ